MIANAREDEIGLRREARRSLLAIFGEKARALGQDKAHAVRSRCSGRQRATTAATWAKR